MMMKHCSHFLLLWRLRLWLLHWGLLLLLWRLLLMWLVWGLLHAPEAVAVVRVAAKVQAPAAAAKQSHTAAEEHCLLQGGLAALVLLLLLHFCCPQVKSSLLPSYPRVNLLLLLASYTNGITKLYVRISCPYTGKASRTTRELLTMNLQSTVSHHKKIIIRISTKLTWYRNVSNYLLAGFPYAIQ